jgi:hypothetical protein
MKRVKKIICDTCRFKRIHAVGDEHTLYFSRCIAVECGKVGEDTQLFKKVSSDFINSGTLVVPVRSVRWSKESCKYHERNFITFIKDLFNG